VPGEHDHGRLGVEPLHLAHHVEPRHAGQVDVGDHDVGPLRVDSGQDGIEVLADGGDLQIGLRREQASHALADEVVVFREHEADWHLEKNTTTAREPLDARFRLREHSHAAASGQVSADNEEGT